MVSMAEQGVELSVVDGVGFTSPAPDTVEVERGGWRLRVKRLDRGVAAALRHLAGRAARYAELETIALATDPAADLGRLSQEVGRLVNRSLLVARCVVGGEELLRATAVSTLARFGAVLPPAGVPIQLSRFAYARRDGDAMVVESPDSYARVEVRAPGLAGLLFRLAVPHPVGQACSAAPGVSADAARAAVALLFGVGILEPAAGEARPQADLREFHDVLMHAANRIGLTDRPIGGTFRFDGTIPPLPALRAVPPGPRVPLPVPDPSGALAHDPPLSRVLADRRSVRTYGAEPITVDQVGEFLHRVARVDFVVPVGPAAHQKYETSRRPYPSGGAAYDLEFYLTVRRCRGLDVGIYHYDPAGHLLTMVCDDAGPIRKLLLQAKLAAGMPEPPQVLVTLASRFGRLSWKYEGMAYATTLKNVGVLYQTMYLTATAMGLAPCALGAGDSAVFAQATGLDPLAESSVGEFMLGTRPEA